MVATISTESLAAAAKALAASVPKLADELASQEAAYTKELDAFLSKLIDGLKPTLKYIDKPQAFFGRSDKRGILLARKGHTNLFLTRQGVLHSVLFPQRGSPIEEDLTPEEAVERFGLSEVLAGILAAYEEALKKINERKPVIEQKAETLRRLKEVAAQ